MFFVVCGSDEEAEMLRECASSECEAMPAASLIPANTGTDLDLIINCDAHVVDVLCRVCVDRMRKQKCCVNVHPRTNVRRCRPCP
jgi:hypothetical protein